MSSRALRKLQKQRESVAHLAQDEQVASSEEEHATVAAPKPKKNAFDLLNAFDEDNEEEPSDNEQQVDTEPEPVAVSPANPTEVSKKKKKKKKKKAAAQKPSTKGETAEAEELDDIDRALKELSTKGDATLNELPTAATATVDRRFAKTPEELLSIDPKSLNAINEMRKLFGNVVLESFDNEENTGSGRRRERQREAIDLGRALSGRYSPASRGQSLAGVALRKNVLMQGKDEWPRATSGGLGMELSQKLPSGNNLYRLLRNQAYQDVQMQFDLCVESMDPQRLIQLLQYNRKLKQLPQRTFKMT